MGEPTAADESVIDRCEGPVLDVGCGPGRMVLALAERGVPALGIDITPVALSIAGPRGAPVLHRDVFGRIPATGRWRTALLMDGNIGIGADPLALLHRVRELLQPAGTLVVEVGGAPVEAGSRLVRVEIGPGVGPWFGWSEVGERELVGRLPAAGFGLEERWEHDGRRFLALRARDEEREHPSG